jgi:hypothetical protein
MIPAPPDATPPQFPGLRLAVDLVAAIVWPCITLTGLIIFRKPIRAILEELSERINTGASFEFLQFKVGAAPSNLTAPGKGDIITADHMALIHSSWRYPKKDAEFGMPMWALNVVIQAKDQVLDRIESAKYLLNPAYPNPIQVVTDRQSRFKLKELANGESTVRCQVKIKGQAEPISLERYINLTATGPKI